MSKINKLGLMFVVLGVSTFRESGAVGTLGMFLLLLGNVLFLLPIEEHLTKRALDGAPLCTCKGNWHQENNPTKCGNCGKTRRQ